MTFSQLFVNSTGLSKAGRIARTPTMRGYVERTEPAAPAQSLTFEGVVYDRAFDVVFHENPHQTTDQDSAPVYGFRCFQRDARTATSSSEAVPALTEIRALEYTLSSGEITAADVLAADRCPSSAPLSVDGRLLSLLMSSDWECEDAATVADRNANVTRW